MLKPILFLLKCQLVIIGILLGFTYPAHAANYYVNSVSGSNSNAGTSTGAAWKDFTPVNSRTFAAGDQLLLSRGSSWGQKLVLNGTGTGASRIIVDAYGTGNRPRLTYNSTLIGIELQTPNYWTIRNLEIGDSTNNSMIYGLFVPVSTGNQNGLTLSNLYVHHIRFGIMITSVGDLSAASYALKDVIVSDCEGTHNQMSLVFTVNSTHSVATSAMNQNILLKNLYFHDDDRGSIPSGEGNSGLQLLGVSNVVMMNCILDRECGSYASAGTIALFLGETSNVRVVNNIFTNTPSTSSPDMGGIDLESKNANVFIHNNYFGGNAGAGIEFLGIHGASDYQSNIDVNGNAFNGNSLVQNPSYSGRGGIGAIGGDIVPTGNITDSLYYEPQGLTFYTINSAGTTGSWSNVSITNNKLALASTDLYSAANQYSAIQGTNNWRYQYNSGSGTWTNLTYYATTTDWRPLLGGSAPRITKFGLIPDVSSTAEVARCWTAPKTGVISLRGRAVKDEIDGGDGVKISIKKNNTVIWGPTSLAYNDQVGLSVAMDSVSVTAGDVIRFVVSSNGNNSYDTTSWSPSVAYAVTPIRTLEFNSDGDAGGWTAANSLTGSIVGATGLLNLNITGTDPQMMSPDNLNFSASTYRYIRIRMKNDTSDTSGRIYFTTTSSTTFDASKSVGFTVTANSGYVDYLIDMANSSGWTGTTVKQLRIDPLQSASSGTLQIDSIRITDG